MPYAVLGVLRDAQDDTEAAIRCLRDGFASDPEASAYAQANSPDFLNKHSEVYVERHAADRWTPIGGRCHVQAYRTLTEAYDQVIRSGYYGDTPKLVHGYCLRFKTIGETPVPSGHAWIEGNGYVLDCGSYIPKLSHHPQEFYYRDKDVFVVHSYTREEAERRFEATRLPFPWDPPPEEFVRERAIWESLQ